MYCVYLTTYLGDALPPFYIGSSSIEKIENGYKGSVLSKRWKNIWNDEIKNNPQLFRVEIIKTFHTRQEATNYEHDYQKKHDVVNSEKYANMAYATKNGFFGRDVSGSNNPMYKNGQKIAKAHKDGKYLNAYKNIPSIVKRQWENPEMRSLMSKNMKGKRTIVVCPFCQTSGGGGNMPRYHFDNCKSKPE